MNNTSSKTRPITTRLHRIFVRSTYLTLVLACVCLVYAELPLMPEVSILAIAVGILMAAAYLVEGKWSLSLFAANAIGAVIAAFAGIWAAYQIISPPTGTMKNIPFPISLLPYMGPLLMICIPAKLFRPKQNADYWGLHVIGLVSVALGCVLADDAIFVALMFAYLLAALWCLALFVVFRNQSPTPAGTAWAARLPRVIQVAGWALPILLVAVLGFLYTPRSGSSWQLSAEVRPRPETGVTEDSNLDLTRSGSLQLNRDVAFEVEAKDNDGRPKLDLDPYIRWRGSVFRYYANGRWTSTQPNPMSAQQPPGMVRGATLPAAPRAGLGPLFAGNTKLPELGPEQYVLTYELKGKLKHAYLATPLVFPADSNMFPALHLMRNDRAGAFTRYPDGSYGPAESFPTSKGRYRQVTRNTAEPLLGSPVPLDRNNEPALFEPPPLPRVTEWTMGVLKQILPPEKLEMVGDPPQFHPLNREAIAQALEQYFAGSGNFKYSLELRRTVTEVDPVEDFLFYTKVGPCTRFASALAVALRSVRIPCQIVLGFRGADGRGDGHYDVRQCHSHTWVEVLVCRQEMPAHKMWLGPTTWYWLTADPTPTDDALEAAAEANTWWNSSQWSTDQLFRDLVLNYSPERREQALSMLAEAAGEIWGAFVKRVTASGTEGVQARLIVAGVAVVGTLGFVLLVRRIARRRAKRRGQNGLSETTAFYRQLVAALARFGATPMEAQTPQEFAVAAAPQLPTAEARALVDRITALYYRVRFGDVPLAPEESKQIDDGLTHLAGLASPNSAA